MAASILTFDERFGGRDLLEHAAQSPSSTGDQTMPTRRLAAGPAVTARVNKGRWIADCPQVGCGGAEYVSFEKPVFFCCECRNEAAGHDLLPVVVPAPTKRRDIESYLLARPTANRHWWPDETIAELRAENRRFGVRLT